LLISFRGLRTYFRPQGKKLLADYVFGAAFDFAVTRNERNAERSEGSTASDRRAILCRVAVISARNRATKQHRTSRRAELIRRPIWTA
jgi:hypothetical protein